MKAPCPAISLTTATTPTSPRIPSVACGWTSARPETPCPPPSTCSRWAPSTSARQSASPSSSRTPPSTAPASNLIWRRPFPDRGRAAPSFRPQPLHRPHTQTCGLSLCPWPVISRLPSAFCLHFVYTEYTPARYYNPWVRKWHRATGGEDEVSRGVDVV